MIHANLSGHATACQGLLIGIADNSNGRVLGGEAIVLVGASPTAPLDRVEVGGRSGGGGSLKLCVMRTNDYLPSLNRHCTQEQLEVRQRGWHFTWPWPAET